jgi:hypothetical protein
MRKQFPEIVTTTFKGCRTETKALELFCTQPLIIAFSLKCFPFAFTKLTNQVKKGIKVHHFVAAEANRRAPNPTKLLWRFGSNF